MSRIDKCFLVANEFVRGDEQDLFFDGEPIEVIDSKVDLLELLVRAGVFASKSQVRSNWANLAAKIRTDSFAIPAGWSDFTVLRPTEANLQ
jgi:hypothetical protein